MRTSVDFRFDLKTSYFSKLCVHVLKRTNSCRTSLLRSIFLPHFAVQVILEDGSGWQQATLNQVRSNCSFDIRLMLITALRARRIKNKTKEEAEEEEEVEEGGGRG